MNLTEKVARAIAEAFGDNFDHVPEGKLDWIRNRGEFGGRFREAGEPYRSDFIAMAEAAIATINAST